MQHYIPTEDTEQAHIFAWAAWASGKYPELDLMHHIPNGGKLSAVQKEWIDALRGQGYKVIVCYGFDEAREVIINYLEG